MTPSLLLIILDGFFIKYSLLYNNVVYGKERQRLGRAIFMTISFITMAFFTIFTFLFSNSHPTIIDIINRLPLIFSPIRLTYILLLFVFFGLGYYCLQAYRKSVTVIQMLLFFINTLLQIVVVYYWYNELTMYSLLALIMQVFGIFVLYVTFPNNRNSLKLRVPIAAWFSWTVFFTLITVNYNMVVYEWNGFHLSDGLWAVILLTVGTAFALHFRYHYYDRVTPFVLIVGYVGIIIANGLNELFVSAAALFLIGALVVGIMYLKKKSTLLK